MLKTLTALLATVALAATSAAQCPIPDGLDGGPCCAPTQLHLPQFPGFKQKSFDICWLDCDVDAMRDVTVHWTKPQTTTGSVSCGPLQSKVRIFDSAGAIIWRGRMRLNYSRTWLETTAAGGTEYQVWRFLVNGDLRPNAAAGAPPCPVPSCAPAFNRVKYSGYVDWALDCQTNTWSNAWMLTHTCDGVDHMPGFPRGGAFHPDRSFTFVGPSASFVPSPILLTEGGGGPFESVRRIRTMPIAGAVGVPICEFEEQIQHSLAPINQFCFCGPSGTFQWMLGDLSIGGACGTGIFTPGGPFLPGFLSMGIGGWTDPATYPGLEQLRWNCGGYDVNDPCTGVLDREVYYGVTTLGGYQGHQVNITGVGAPLPPIYIDQANALRRLGGPLMNLPFITGRILNLNH